jgi:hypothetical protein
VQTGVPFEASVVTRLCCWDRSFAISLWFKGQRNLSFRNDFKQQRLETARIATLSQQIALKDPNKFSGDRNTPPPCFDGGGGMSSDLAALNQTTQSYGMSALATTADTRKERVIGGVNSEDDPRPFASVHRRHADSVPGVDDLVQAPRTALSGWTLAASGTLGVDARVSEVS